MDIFISWSGDRSKVIAEALRDWLPKVVQRVKPWLSASDIDKGARWLKDISEKLAQTNFGIVCLTPENLNEPWVLFETGALSKVLGASSICPILIDLDPSSLKGPLSQFQATRIEEEDMRSLLKAINKGLEEGALPEAQLNETFSVWWPKLEEDVKKRMQLLATGEKQPERSERDILLEILKVVRSLDRNTAEGLIWDRLRRLLATLPPQMEKDFRMRWLSTLGVAEDMGKQSTSSEVLTKDLRESKEGVRKKPSSSKIRKRKSRE